MKIAIGLLVLVLLLGGGGYFGWTTYLSGDDAEPILAADDSPGYIELKPITVPFVRDGKFAHYVVLVVHIEVANETAMSKVKAYMPKLRDAFVSELHALAAVRPASQKLINVARVKARLMAGTERVLGPDVVRDVLVQLAH